MSQYVIVIRNPYNHADPLRHVLGPFASESEAEVEVQRIRTLGGHPDSGYEIFALKTTAEFITAEPEEFYDDGQEDPPVSVMPDSFYQ